MKNDFVDDNLDNIGQVQYYDLFKKGLLYFDELIESVKFRLESCTCVTISGLPKMGKRRFCQYLQFQKIAGNPWLQNVEIVEDFASLSPKEKKKIETEIFNKNSGKKYIIQLQLEDLKLSYSQGITLSTMLHNVLFITPFIHEKALQYVKTVEYMYNAAISPEKFEELYFLSAGHAGIIKWGILLSSQWETSNELLKFVEIQNIMQAIEHQTAEQSLEILYNCGFCDQSGNCVIPLYREFVGPKVQLDSPLYRELLSVFLSKRGEIIPFSTLEKIIANYGDYSLWGTYKTLSRFKTAVASVYSVKNSKGKGYFIQ